MILILAVASVAAPYVLNWKTVYDVSVAKPSNPFDKYQLAPCPPISALRNTYQNSVCSYDVEYV